MAQGCGIRFKRVGQTDLPIGVATEALDVAKEAYRESKKLSIAAAESYAHLVESNYGPLIKLSEWTKWLNNRIASSAVIKEEDFNVELGDGYADIKTDIVDLLNQHKQIPLDDKSKAVLAATRKDLKTRTEPLTQEKALKLVNAIQNVIEVNQVNNSALKTRNDAVVKIPREISSLAETFPAFNKLVSLEIIAVPDSEFSTYLEVFNKVKNAKNIDADFIHSLTPKVNKILKAIPTSTVKVSSRNAQSRKKAYSDLIETKRINKEFVGIPAKRFLSMVESIYGDLAKLDIAQTIKLNEILDDLNAGIMPDQKILELNESVYSQEVVEAIGGIINRKSKGKITDESTVTRDEARRRTSCKSSS